MSENSNIQKNSLQIILKIWVCAALLGTLSSFTSVDSNTDFKAKRYSIKTVVIDAGHGGHDYGCIGSSTREKEMALLLSLKLGKLIEENHGDVEVIYTRKTDTFIELHRRAEIANRNNADLFICIHFNSGAKTAYGAETFVMGLHKSAANLEVAKRENASILKEDDYQKQYDGFDPNSEEATIIFTLYQNAHLDQSLAFASKVQDKFRRAGRFDRGVKQAGFLVLWRTNMPAVLIESGFLSNKDEQAFFRTGNGINKTAVSIFKAFREYKAIAEGEKIPAEDEPFIGMEDFAKTETYKVVTEEVKPPFEIKKDTLTITNLQAEMPDSLKIKNLGRDSIAARKMSKSDLENYKEDLKKEKLKTEMEIEELRLKNKLKVLKVEPPEGAIDIKPPQTSTENTNTVCFRVQFYSSGEKLSLNNPKFKGLADVWEYEDKGKYKYTSGKTTDFSEAGKLQSTVRKAGFADAFIVAFRNDERISIEDARKLLNK